MYNFHQRLTQLFTLDKIRICKIVEIFQYTIIFSILVIIFSYLLNKYYFTPLKIINHDEPKMEDQLYSKIIKSLLVIMFDLFIITLIFFYIRKIGLLIPSISGSFCSNFKSYTTYEYIIHISIVVFFIELLPEFKIRIEKLNELINQINQSD